MWLFKLLFWIQYWYTSYMYNIRIEYVQYNILRSPFQNIEDENLIWPLKQCVHNLATVRFLSFLFTSRDSDYYLCFLCRFILSLLFFHPFFFSLALCLTDINVILGLSIRDKTTLKSVHHMLVADSKLTFIGTINYNLPIFAHWSRLFSFLKPLSAYIALTLSEL